jgi:hypothetical protein
MSRDTNERFARRLWVAATLALASASVILLSLIDLGSAVDEQSTPVAWSNAVRPICAHALLFEERHEIGTRAGALAVAADIRSSTERRLERIAAIPAPPARSGLVTRLLALERRLAASYATSYLGIYDVIAAARTPAQRSREPRLVGRLLHAPDLLSNAGAHLEHQLHVPDCTGGTVRLSPSRPAIRA